MASPSRTRCIGILTSGGDCPGLNAAIRGVVKACINEYGMQVLGILDGFRGLIENRFVPLEDRDVSGILTVGGTILGTSRDKPHKMPMGGRAMDLTGTAVENARRMGLDCLICLGGGGTQKNALHLHRTGGLNVLTLPKTIDNDVEGTDVSFGFDTALSIATEAIDRLHSTATSHNRMIVCEVMGHNTGWLALGAGSAGGADVILIPEIPFSLEAVAEHLLARRRSGKRFSIICLAEGARSKEEAAAEKRAAREQEKRKGRKEKHARAGAPPFSSQNGGSVEDEDGLAVVQEPRASRIARQLQQLTGSEARVTTLGHVQRGGSPTPADRLLCTRLGTMAAELLAKGVYNVMVAVRGERCEPVPLEEIAGRRKTVPLDHPWLRAAKLVGVCLGE